MICFIVVCSVFIINFNLNPTKAYADSNGSVFDRIDAYLSETTAKAHFPAMSITIVDKENVLFSKTYIPVVKGI